MQLDQTHVAVRVRTLSEIGDLALVLLHRYPTTLLVGFALGALPWILLNAAVLYWIPLTEAQYGLSDDEAFAEISRYLVWMALLVFLQAPAAGVITTIYLGQAVFEQKPTWRGAMRAAREQFWRWFYCLAIRRLAFPVWVYVAFRMFQPVNPFFDGVVPALLFLTSLVVRASRPFLPEMVLLEMCPLRSKDDREITLSRRARALHRPAGNDVGSRWFSIGITLLVLFAGFFYSLMFVRGVTTGYWHFGSLFNYLVIFPLSLWVVAGLSVIVRMIAYLDTRIRLEGWDVELAVRAEAIRQFGEEAGAVRVTGPSAASVASAENLNSPGVASPTAASPGTTTRTASTGATT
ncbi:MAG: hypothetical protein AAFX06_05575 [Planctomycetota bacterium]